MSKKTIPYGCQTINKEDVKAVTDVLTADYITQGPKVEEFEKALCECTGAEYAVAVNSGTAALHAAYYAVGLTSQDEFITSPLTFAATSNAGLYLNAKPIFCDINKKTGCIDLDKIENKITNKTKLLVPIYYGGLPVNLRKISRIAKKHNLKIVADGCHALGAKYKDRIIGSTNLVDATVFSFHPVKHITTGEGGAILTNKREIYEKARLFRSHGITKNKSRFKNEPLGAWYYEMQDLGFNYRITDIQCALGISQIKRINGFIKKRREIASRYNTFFDKLNEVSYVKENKGFFNAYHLYPILVKKKHIKKKLFNYLRKNDIYCQTHYIPVYWHPYYQNKGYKKGLCPNAINFYEREISIPIYPSLKTNEQEKVVSIIENFYEK